MRHCCCATALYRVVSRCAQTFNLLATMSAFENVELPMVIRGKLSRNECKARALELLDSQSEDAGAEERSGAEGRGAECRAAAPVLARCSFLLPRRCICSAPGRSPDQWSACRTATRTSPASSVAESSSECERKQTPFAATGTAHSTAALVVHVRS